MGSALTCDAIARLGYAFDKQPIPRNVEYYDTRSSHGSTLSRVVHSWVLARSDRPPPELKRLDMSIRYRGHSLDLRITRDTLTVRGHDLGGVPIKLEVTGRTYDFMCGSTREFRLSAARRQAAPETFLPPLPK